MFTVRVDVLIIYRKERKRKKITKKTRCLLSSEESQKNGTMTLCDQNILHSFYETWMFFQKRILRRILTGKVILLHREKRKRTKTNSNHERKRGGNQFEFKKKNLKKTRNI